MAIETAGGVQAVKAARNQALWREVNERIRIMAETWGDLEFLCECARLNCIERIQLTVAEYERIRSSPTCFPIAVGHEFPEIEKLVELSDRYAVVQKSGEAAAESRRLDPRSRAS